MKRTIALGMRPGGRRPAAPDEGRRPRRPPSSTARAERHVGRARSSGRATPATGAGGASAAWEKQCAKRFSVRTLGTWKRDNWRGSKNVEAVELIWSCGMVVRIDRGVRGDGNLGDADRRGVSRRLLRFL